jgi:hypothetical protein
MTIVKRLTYPSEAILLRDDDILIVRTRKGTEKRIPSDKWGINRNTPVGENADLFEHKPHGGKKHIAWKNVLFVERIMPKDWHNVQEK